MLSYFWDYDIDSSGMKFWAAETDQKTGQKSPHFLPALAGSETPPRHFRQIRIPSIAAVRGFGFRWLSLHHHRC
jgi:hypothetical protein